jgi:hypothetical protein
MDSLWAQKEAQIQPLLPAKMLVVVGSYSGNDDLTVDQAAADAILVALFPKRWKEACTLNVSAKTVTASVGACDAEIMPLLYKDDVLVDDTLYTFTAGTGVFLFADAPASGTYTATFVKHIYGAKVAEYDSSFPNKTQDIMAFGAIDAVYSSTQYEDSKHTVKVSGTHDVSKLRRKYPTADIEKAFYGSQWSATTAAENEFKRNSNPFFVAVIWWNPDATTGQVEVKQVVYYKCTLNKAIGPIPDGMDNPAKFEADAVALYSRTKTIIKS